MRRTVDRCPAYGGGLSKAVTATTREGVTMTGDNATTGICAAGISTAPDATQRVSGFTFLRQWPLAHGESAVGCQPSSVFTHVHVTTLNDIGTSRDSTSRGASATANAVPITHTLASSRFNVKTRPMNARKGTGGV